MSTYFNEFDPNAAQWLRNLIAAGHLPAGDVDERSITDVRADDLRGYTQWHFFAGIGGWGHALRLAGWPDDRPIWTGSCPCQPFSNAGKGAGTDDPRHLWPDFFRLIAAVRPPVVMGEQVAGQAGYGWLDGVRTDLASEGYASRGVDIPACAVDAPHIRQRLYWVARSGDVENANGSPEGRRHVRGPGEGVGAHHIGSSSQPGRPDAGDEYMADALRQGWNASALPGVRRGEEGAGPWDGEPERLHGNEFLADADRGGRDGRPEGEEWTPLERAIAERADAWGGHVWGDAESVGRGEGRAEPVILSGRSASAGTDARGGSQGVALGDPCGSGLPTPQRGSAFRAGRREEGGAASEPDGASGSRTATGDLADSTSYGREQGVGASSIVGYGGEPAATNSATTFWSGADRLLCHDGKTRRTQPGVPMLVDGVRGRVAIGSAIGEADHPQADQLINRIIVWKGVGNAIVPQEAEQVIRAYMETCA